MRRRRAAWLLLLLPFAMPAAAFALGKLVASPSSITFPTACVRSTGRPSSVTISNDGDTEAESIRVSASPSQLFILSGSTLVPTLSPGEKATFAVRFVPGRAGSQSGTVRIDYEAVRPTPTENGEGQEDPTPSPRTTPRVRNVSVSGSGIDRFIDSFPRALNFGDVRVGRPGGRKGVVVYDDGDSTLDISSISIGGEHAGDFRVFPRGGATVTDGNPLELSVSFTPNGVGVREAEVVIRSNSCTDPTFTIALAGIGVEPDIIAAPRVLQFEQREIDRKQSKGMSIVNQGGYPLRVSDIDLVGTDRSHFAIVRDPDLPDTLQPGQQIDVRIRFTALEPGLRVAELFVRSNDPDRPVLRVKLRGTVVEPEPTPTPSLTLEPTPTATAAAPPPSAGISLGRYAGEALVAAAVAAFFAMLVLVRRVRGIPE